MNSSLHGFKEIPCGIFIVKLNIIQHQFTIICGVDVIFLWPQKEI